MRASGARCRAAALPPPRNAERDDPLAKGRGARGPSICRAGPRVGGAPRVAGRGETHRPASAAAACCVAALRLCGCAAGHLTSNPLVCPLDMCPLRCPLDIYVRGVRVIRVVAAM
jgi:hypothetical protein